MTKRQKAAEERRQREIAAIERELRLIATGSYGCTNVEDDPENEVCLYDTLGCKAWLRFIQAIASHWHFLADDSDGYPREYMMKVHHLHNYESLDGAARFLHAHGAREGGEWEPKQ